jgi:hypothetical protein
VWLAPVAVVCGTVALAGRVPSSAPLAVLATTGVAGVALPATPAGVRVRAVPVVLASVVGIYLMWAIAAANALFR